jgi:phage FluMu protein Com
MDAPASADDVAGGSAQTMSSSRRKPIKEEPTQIECLACGDVRVVTGLATHETGECPRCRYLGWTYSDELDGTTRRAIMNGEFALNAAGPAVRLGTARARGFV